MNKIFILLVLIIATLMAACNSAEKENMIATPDEIEALLHVASPAWEDQVIYFIVTDRFMDGDTTNNDMGQGEYRPGDGAFWNGGDLRGIIQRLDYIKELGVADFSATIAYDSRWERGREYPVLVNVRTPRQIIEYSINPMNFRIEVR